MTAHTCLNGGAMGFREPSCVACRQEYPMMTDRPDLAALRALAEAATPGPWDSGPQFPDDPSKTEFYVQERSLHYLICRMNQLGEHHTGPWEWSPVLHPRADAAYIAACSPERILALIAEVEEWRMGARLLDREEARHAR